MGKYLIDENKEAGIKTILHTHSEGEHIEVVQDAEEIVKYNEEKGKRLRKKSDWWHVGRIPLTICHQWALESNTKVFTKAWQEFAKKKIQLPEYRKLNVNNIKL